MRRRHAEMMDQPCSIVREHRDAVGHVGLATQPRAALVEGEHAIVFGEDLGEPGEYRLIALRAMNHDQRRTVAAQLIGQLDSIDKRALHTALQRLVSVDFADAVPLHEPYLLTVMCWTATVT